MLKFSEFSLNPDFLLKGEGVTVEIDKSKFKRRKYHRGRRVKGLWVFWAIQSKTPEITSRALLISVPNQTREKFSITQRWIKPGIPHVLNLGPTAISDGWTSYLGNYQMGYLHLIVNHSQTFVDPTRKHTLIQLKEIGSMPDPVFLQRKQENGYLEAIFWKIFSSY
ncbi:hypothetical protein RF11_13483 [Thelohanellus kitauei]|uniref:ISXO2-like transposase domain-containing protein n=1 Tax=Thelohanellus kitauei TaxID=669202 RepID=A0A0C2NCE0_THEKT|nr:hypothetical protein RF11_13483 [Thelohanellus kitauei]